MQGYASREAAVHILLEHESSGAFLKDLFGRHTEGLPKQDRGLVREIALGVIRNLTLLDHNINLYATKKPGVGPLRTILRITAYQLFFMDVPDFAAVNVGVELAKRKESQHQGGFVNAILKKMIAAGLQKVPGGTVRALAVNYSHPEWMIRRWYKRLGGDGLLKALERNNQEAPVWLRVNPLRGNLEELKTELAQLNVVTESDADAPWFLRVENKGGAEAVLHSELFADGKIAFQDPAAALIAKLADWSENESLLDLCAAPGGKAACLTESLWYRNGDATLKKTRTDLKNPSPLIVCNDISWRRLSRIHDAIDRLGHKRLAPIVMDPAHAALRSRFDVIIVDAPCSNLGVLRRRPEARWSRSQADLNRLSTIQGNLLRDAAKLTSPGGRIIYATCSPEEEETLLVVRTFLAENADWKLEDAGTRLPAWAVKEGFLWLYPGESDYDGFFAARLVRA